MGDDRERRDAQGRPDDPRRDASPEAENPYRMAGPRPDPPVPRSAGETALKVLGIGVGILVAMAAFAGIAMLVLFGLLLFICSKH